jgi:2',3'-cyclic-nucleotide 2'-phosphodiesterase (5'-nucleotidase family)
MTAVLKTLNDELNVTLDIVVARTPFDLDGARERVRAESTNLGRIICESLIQATGADVGFLNSGAIRASVPKGEITRGQVLSVLPDGSPYTYYEAKTVMVGDKPLDNDAVYSVATNDFLAVGGDGFETFSKYPRSEFGTLEEALLTCLATAGDAALQAINDANVLTIEK